LFYEGFDVLASKESIVKLCKMLFMTFIAELGNTHIYSVMLISSVPEATDSISSCGRLKGFPLEAESATRAISSGGNAIEATFSIRSGIIVLSIQNYLVIIFRWVTAFAFLNFPLGKEK